MRVPAPKKAESAPQTRKRGVGEPTRDYTKIHNAFWELMETGKLCPGIQDRLVLIIMRMTWGAKDRPEYAAIPLDLFSEKSGGADRSGISRELADLEERGLVRSKKTSGCQTGLKLYSMTPVKCWKDAKPYVSRLPALKPDEPESDKLIVRPGGKPAAITAQLCPVGRDPVDFRLEYVNAGSIAVGVSSCIEADVVRITFGDHKAKQQQKQPGSCGLESTQQKANTVDDNRLNEYSLVVKNLLLSQFEKPFDPSDPADKTFLAQILENAGEIPADYYEAYCKAALHEMVRRRKPIYSGILRAMATQAAKKFALVQCNFAPDSPTATPPPVELTAAEIEVLSYCVRCNDTGNDGTWDRGKFSPFTKPFRTCPACDGKRAGAAKVAIV